MDSPEQGRSPRECCWVWKGLRPVCVSLCPTNPEQEPRKSKGQSQALAPGEPGAPSWPCWICLHPMRGSLGSPRASTVAVQLLSALCGPQEVRGSGHGGASSSHQPFPLPAARLPAPQALLARTLVSSGALGKERAFLAALPSLPEPRGDPSPVSGLAGVALVAGVTRLCCPRPGAGGGSSHQQRPRSRCLAAAAGPAGLDLRGLGDSVGHRDPPPAAAPGR